MSLDDLAVVLGYASKEEMFNSGKTIGYGDDIVGIVRGNEGKYAGKLIGFEGRRTSVFWFPIEDEYDLEHFLLTHPAAGPLGVYNWF